MAAVLDLYNWIISNHIRLHSTLLLFQRGVYLIYGMDYGMD